MSLFSTWLAYLALQISMIFRGSRGNPFSARVAATSCVCRTRKPFSADFLSIAKTASSKGFSVVTVCSKGFMSSVHFVVFGSGHLVFHSSGGHLRHAVAMLEDFSDMR